MNAALVHKYGAELTSADYDELARRWITPELAEQAGIRRADSRTGKDIVGRKSGDCAGLIIPYVNPLTSNIDEYQLRLDNPDMVAGNNGELKPKMRYLWPPQKRGRAYFTPGTDPALLQDATVPAVITEGAFKCLALHKPPRHQIGS